MVTHNVKLAVRNFQKHRTQFIINLLGLSTALSCVFFIYLWVADELSVDRFHSQSSLYHIYSHHTDASGTNTWPGVPGLLMDELEAFPEIEHTTVMMDVHPYSISDGQTYFKAAGRFADPGFFDVFTFPIVKGAERGKLEDKSAIVLTQSFANRVFGSDDVVGKSLSWHFRGIKKDVYVSAVMADIPATSSRQFDFIMSWDYFHDDLITYKQWGNYYARIALTLNDEAAKEKVEAGVNSIFQKNLESDKVSLFLTPYKDLYLHGNFEGGKQAGGRIEYVNLFIIVAAFILFIACVNFVNLSTAKASQRGKEISVKKTMGASRHSLVGQYLTESVVISILATLAALGIVYLSLPQFNLIAQKQLNFSFDLSFGLMILSIMLFVGVLAGSYPALYLSSFNPVALLKGKIMKSNGEVRGRKALVVAQFAISIILIVSVIVVQKQMNYIQSKNLGYSRDNVVYIEREGELMQNAETFISELNNTPGIQGAALSGFRIGGANSTGGVHWEGKTEEDQVQFWEIKAGEGLIDLLNMELVDGRDFSSLGNMDSTSVIFNETALEAMGMTEPLGKTIWHYTGTKKIVGVVKDFNLISLHQEVQPMIFLYNPAESPMIAAKLSQGNESAALSAMEDLFKKINPGYVFEPHFLDQDYDTLYQSEQRVAVLARYFSGLAILISCLGLFGLSAFTLERKTKEIGIRKVLGAGQWNIVYSLSNEFTKMVLSGMIIAIPVSYYLVDNWLDDFAYKIDLSWWVFAAAGVGALVVAWLTVSIQTIRASLINPVDSLRSE